MWAPTRQESGWPAKISSRRKGHRGSAPDRRVRLDTLVRGAGIAANSGIAESIAPSPAAECVTCAVVGTSPLPPALPVARLGGSAAWKSWATSRVGPGRTVSFS